MCQSLILVWLCIMQRTEDEIINDICVCETRLVELSEYYSAKTNMIGTNYVAFGYDLSYQYEYECMKNLLEFEYSLLQKELDILINT